MGAMQSLEQDLTSEPHLTSTAFTPSAKIASLTTLFVDSEAQTKRVEAEKVHLLYTQAAPASHLPVLIGAVLLVCLLWPVVAPGLLLMWLTTMSMIVASTWLLVRRYQQSGQRGPDHTERWRRLYCFNAALSGSSWGLAGFFLFPTTSDPHQLLLIVFLGGVSVIAVAYLAIVRSVFLSFFSTLALPTLVRLLLNTQDSSFMIVILVTSFTVFLIPIANYLHASVVESLRLRFHNLDLVESLSAAKEQAEQAQLQLAASHAALRKSEERFRLLVEQAADVITILNTDGTIRYISPSVESWLGHSPDALLGQPLARLLHPHDQGQVHTVIHLCREGVEQKHTFEAQWQHHGGTWRVVESVMRNFLEDETVNGLTLSSRDITARKEVERLKDELVSTVSHELRTPLTSLRGFTELMLTRDFPTQQQRRFLTIMNDEATRLTNLINNFLDLQRIESGQQPHAVTGIDVTPLLCDTVALFANGTATHSFQLAVPDSLPTVRVDSDQIRQVLINLLSNASKFSPEGGLITVSAQHTADSLEVCVTDNGIGIPAEAIPQLFNKFFRVDNTATRQINGTGLGLALVKQIIEAHQGRVWVTSELGKGSTFAFSLPVAG